MTISLSYPAWGRSSIISAFLKSFTLWNGSYDFSSLLFFSKFCGLKTVSLILHKVLDFFLLHPSSLPDRNPRSPPESISTHRPALLSSDHSRRRCWRGSHLVVSDACTATSAGTLGGVGTVPIDSPPPPAARRGRPSPNQADRAGPTPPQLLLRWRRRLMWPRWSSAAAE